MFGGSKPDEDPGQLAEQALQAASEKESKKKKKKKRKKKKDSAKT